MDKPVLIKHIYHRGYKQFVKECLQTNDCIVISYAEYAERELPALGKLKCAPQREKLSRYIAFEQRLVCYTIEYRKALEVFEQFDSLSDFLKWYDVWEIWFLKNDHINIHIDVEQNEVLCF